jgi:hypothetical protein
MILSPLLLALALTAVQPDREESRRYVPSTGWRDNKWAARFYERWYGGQLRAMNEDPLRAPTSRKDLRRTFRLLVLPNSTPASMYRIEFGAEGGATLRWVRLDGRGGYAPGRIAEEVSRPLTPNELDPFIAAFQEADLGSRKRELPPEPVRRGADGSEIITICHHPTTYVFEHISRQGRVFITRDYCDIDEPLRRLVRAVFRLRANQGGGMEQEPE